MPRCPGFRCHRPTADLQPWAAARGSAGGHVTPGSRLSPAVWAPRLTTRPRRTRALSQGTAAVAGALALAVFHLRLGGRRGALHIGQAPSWSPWGQIRVEGRPDPGGSGRGTHEEEGARGLASLGTLGTGLPGPRDWRPGTRSFPRPRPGPLTAPWPLPSRHLSACAHPFPEAQTGGPGSWLTRRGCAAEGFCPAARAGMSQGTASGPAPGCGPASASGRPAAPEDNGLVCIYLSESRLGNENLFLPRVSFPAHSPGHTLPVRETGWHSYSGWLGASDSARPSPFGLK